MRTFVDTEARTDEAAADLVDAYIAFAKELGAELPALHPAAIDKVEVAGDGAKLAAFIRLVAVDPVPEHMSPRFTALAFSRDGGRTWTVSIVDCRPKEILREFLPAWNGSPAL